VRGVVGSLVVGAGSRALMYMVTKGQQATHLLSLYQPCRKIIRSAKCTFAEIITKNYINRYRKCNCNKRDAAGPVISMYVHFTVHTSDVLINK
jgi:hypothetical protein